jgi:curved DNA-binding protein CbpA
MDPINYYKILQVDPEAEQDVIKAAYRALSRKYHPDGSHPSTERMVRLNDAYAVLSDPPARARHNDELEHRDFVEGKAPVRPAAPPRMRYQEVPEEPPKPRRTYRRRNFGVGVMTQIVGISICVIGVMASGILRPVMSSQPEPTPTPPAFALTPEDLISAYEEDGYSFTQGFTLRGDPIVRGSDPDSIVTIYISDDGTVVTDASLFLTQGDDLIETQTTRQQDAINRLLGATIWHEPDKSAAVEWIASHDAFPEAMDATVIAGWLIRHWPASEDQIGIMLRPTSGR